MRFLKEDPWTDFKNKSAPNILKQRKGSNAVGYKNYPNTAKFFVEAAQAGLMCLGFLTH